MGPAQPILLAFSGGKDSLMALAKLSADPDWNVVGLLATVDDGDDERLAMHGVPLTLVRAQARALGLPLRVMRVSTGADNQAYASALEEALDDARRLQPRLSDLAFGDLHLADVRAWRETLLRDMGWGAVFPLWGADTAGLAGQFIDEGWKARLVCVDTQVLDGRFVGREFDRALLAELPPGCDPCGENGEFHTFLYDGPSFSEPVAFGQGEPWLDAGRFQRVNLSPAQPES